MAKIITFANRKGGTGKTSTTIASGQLLAKKGFKVLFIDLDGQANTTTTLNADLSTKNALNVLMGFGTAKECIQHLNYDVLASDLRLNSIGKELIQSHDTLKNALEPINNDYDFILIDTPPDTEKEAVINALCSSDYLVITTNTDVYGMDGVNNLFEIVKAVKENMNPDLKVMGVLITRFKANTLLSKLVLEQLNEMANDNGTIVFNSKIRECIEVQKAQAIKKDLNEIAPKSNAVIDYEAFVNELLEIVQAK